MKNILTPSAKKFLSPFGLSAEMSATDTATQKRIYWSGSTALTISNEEIEDIMKVVQSLEGSRLLIQEISEIIKNDTKEQKGAVLSLLLGTLSARLLEMHEKEG